MWSGRLLTWRVLRCVIRFSLPAKSPGRGALFCVKRTAGLRRNDRMPPARNIAEARKIMRWPSLDRWKAWLGVGFEAFCPDLCPVRNPVWVAGTGTEPEQGRAEKDSRKNLFHSFLQSTSYNPTSKYTLVLPFCCAAKRFVTMKSSGRPLGGLTEKNSVRAGGWLPAKR